jgi:ATP phosphoribosyltransferase regulatory subunit
MTTKSQEALLPAGMMDVLPPNAEIEAVAMEKLMSVFGTRGYERVIPPLAEFEELLLSGSGEATKTRSFRVMDPISQRMLALRADMTIQIERIASTRLSDLPRPLRLSYAGPILRTSGSNLHPERQFYQVGAELIGSDSSKSDTEIISMAAHALLELGLNEISVDLGLPSLITSLLDEYNVKKLETRNTVRTACNQKDEAMLSSLHLPESRTFIDLMRCVGPADESIKKLKALDLPEKAIKELNYLIEVITLMKDQGPELSVTIDPVEIRGYEYHSGLTYTFFSKNSRGEIGRGGRYLLSNKADLSQTENGTGISLYLSKIVELLPSREKRKKVMAYSGISHEIVAEYIRNGWIVISQLETGDDIKSEAQKLNCTHILGTDGIEDIS